MQSDFDEALKSREHPRSDYIIERIGSADELATLRESWGALTAEIPDCSFFLSWEWMDSWWRTLRNDHRLWLLTARNREGRLVGIAPLMFGRKRLGPLILRRLSFLGNGLARPAHLDILARPGEDETLAAAFVRYLRGCREEWDLLELEGLREDSPLASVLATAPGRCLTRHPVACSFVSLPASWEEFQEHAMSAKLRKTIRYYERRLEKAFPGQVAFETVNTGRDLHPALEFLLEKSRSQFRQKGMVSCFENRDFRYFFETLVATALDRGLLRFYQLKVRDEIIAVQQCFRFQDTCYGYQTAFAPDWSKYSPGQQLLAYLFRESILEKAREIDMLHGETDYKSSWASGRRLDAHLLYASNFRGRLGVLGVGLLDKAIVLGRKWIPEGIRKHVNRWLARKAR